MAEIPKMRTLPEAIKELKKIDPETAFTLRALRRMVNNNEIPVTHIGTAVLINFNTLLEYLGGGNSSATSSAERGKIHRISG